MTLHRTSGLENLLKQSKTNKQTKNEWMKSATLHRTSDLENKTSKQTIHDPTKDNWLEKLN